MRFVIVVLAFVLHGCGSSVGFKGTEIQDASEVPFSGKSVSDGALRTEIVKMAIPYAHIDSGCRGPIKSIRVEAVDYTSVPQSNEKGELISGTFKERWTLSCREKEKALYITIRPLPGGQSRFSVSVNP